MSKLKFSDGITFDVHGPYRVEHRRDGYYVLGNGILIPVDSALEGYRFIDKLAGRKGYSSE